MNALMKERKLDDMSHEVQNRYAGSTLKMSLVGLNVPATICAVIVCDCHPSSDTSTVQYGRKCWLGRKWEMENGLIYQL